jgi:hypothetical protein
LLLFWAIHPNLKVIKIAGAYLREYIGGAFILLDTTGNLKSTIQTL